MNKERNYGIDLLRFVLMFMVCMLHTLGQGGILGLCPKGSPQFMVFLFLDILAYCAVDGFVIISGYMASDKPRKYDKLINMWFQVFFYSFIVTIIFIITGVFQNWNIRYLVRCALPVTTSYYWFFTAFFLLFLAIPVLNKFVLTVDENTAKKAIIIIFVLFSILGVVSDPFSLGEGYSAIWVLVLYCIGALAKKIKIFETRKSSTLIIIFFLCILITWIADGIYGIERLKQYVSPTILLCGLVLVVLFSRFHLKGTIISKLSPFVFGIYLFQLNKVIWDTFLKNSFGFVVKKNIVVGVIYAIICAAGIFLGGMIVDIVRSGLAKLLRIPALSRKIFELIDKGIEKLFILLK